MDIHNEVIDWGEMKDLQKSFLKSQVAYQDTPQDLAIFSALYKFAAKNNFKYILTGANYSTECVREPIEWCYFATDTRHVKDIHKKFGSKPLKKFYMCDIFKYKTYHKYVKRIKVIQPLNNIPYIKEDVIDELSERFGWERYTNKHFESIFTRFFEGYWLPKKFGFDKRRAHFSSLILTGQLSRDEALNELEKPPYNEELAIKDLEYIATRLDMTKEEFMKIMNEPNKYRSDYKSNATLINLATRFLMLIGVEKRMLR